MSDECPICFEAIEVGKNCVTTECGHCFHASCLLTNVSHNGFGCPYCRTVMAEEIEDEDDEDEYEEEEEEDDEHVLRGFRLFMNNVYGEEHEEEDNLEEEEYNDYQEDY